MDGDRSKAPASVTSSSADRAILTVVELLPVAVESVRAAAAAERRQGKTRGDEWWGRRVSIRPGEILGFEYTED